MAAKALLIDYGGVLYYEASKSILHEAIANYLASLGVNVNPQEAAEALNGWSLEGPVEQNVGYAAALVLSRFGVTPKSRKVNGLERVMKAAVISISRPMPWAREILVKAKSLGLRIALVSNHWCHDCVVSTLERDGLDDFFDAVITSDLVGYCKPDPHIFEAALKLLNVNACEAVFIDDNEVNVEGAVKAGLLGAHRFVKSFEGVNDALRFIEGHVSK